MSNGRRSCHDRRGSCGHGRRKRFITVAGRASSDGWRERECVLRLRRRKEIVGGSALRDGSRETMLLLEEEGFCRGSKVEQVEQVELGYQGR